MPSPAAWMSRALELARKADARVEPNPRVGAVLVRDDLALGEGFHVRADEPHAEILALRAAGEAARGATLYVTLEPCNHTGRTPPCTAAILAAGVRKVVAARRDPNRTVAGGGLELLRARGVETECGLLEAEATDLIAPFVKAHERGLPWVTLKWAMSIDGKIATRTRDSKWITGEATRALARERRAQFGAILVGIETALADDPALTSARPDEYTPLRVVVDSSARLPPTSQLVRSAARHPVLVAIGSRAPAHRVDALVAAGCAVFRADDARGRVDLRALLAHLVGQGAHSLLVEGGAGIAGSLVEARLADEVHAYLAPVILGGREAVSPVAGAGTAAVADALRGRLLEVEQADGDLFLRVRLPASP